MLCKLDGAVRQRPILEIPVLGVQMDRRLLPFLLVALIFALAPHLRADDAAADQAFFDKQTSKFVKLQPTRLTADVLGKVFNGIFYNVNVVTSDGGSNKAVVARTGDDITIITIPSSTADVPDLVKLLKAGFT